MKDFVNLNNLKKHGESVDRKWYLAAQMSGQQALYQRRFAINTGWPRFPVYSKQVWVRELLVNEVEEMYGFLDTLNEIFGGEVHVNGCLSLKDRRRVGAVPKWNPRDVIIDIKPERNAC